MEKRLREREALIFFYIFSSGGWFAQYFAETRGILVLHAVAAVLFIYAMIAFGIYGYEKFKSKKK